jgi:hypothetical protein
MAMGPGIFYDIDASSILQLIEVSLEVQPCDQNTRFLANDNARE